MKAYHELLSKEEKIIDVFNTEGSVDGITVHPHWHEHIEILHVVKGSAIQHIEDKRFDINKGDVVIVGINQIHATYTRESENAYIVVYHFNLKDLVGDKAGYGLQIIELFSGILTLPKPIKTKDFIGNKIKELLVAIESASLNDTLPSKCRMQSLCTELIGVCIEHYELDEGYRTGLSTERAKSALSEAFEYIDLHYQQKMTLDEVAMVTGFSVPHFSRLIRKATGKSFITYLNHYRINKAIAQMLDGKSITEAAYESGYGNISSFNRSFKTYKGMSPRLYMKRYN